MAQKNKNFKVTHLENEYLTQLTYDPTSGVELLTDKLHLSFHPFYLQDFRNSVKEILNNELSRYSKSLKGILLGYQNLKLSQNIGTIFEYDAQIHVDVEADFFIFKPEIGLELRGVVNKKSHTHVGCLLHKIFNVALPKPDEENDEGWLGHSVQIGQEVLFHISYTNLNARIPYLRGVLRSIVAGCDSGVNNDEEESVTVKPSKKRKFEDTEAPSTSKKSKHVYFDNMGEDEGYETTDCKVKQERMDYDEIDIEVPKKKKKKTIK